MKKLILVVLTIFFLSCSKNKRDIELEKTASDSLDYYMKLVNKSNTSQYNKSLYIDRAFRLIVNIKNTKKNRDTLFSISYKHYTSKDWKKFDPSSLRLIKNSIEAKDSLNLVKAYRYRAGYFKNIEVNDSAFFYYIKGEKISTIIKDKPNLANILLNKGIVQYYVGDFLGAELSLSKAYSIFTELNESEKIYGTLNQLGLVCNELKEYDKAVFYHNKALETVDEYKLENEEHQKAVCYNNLGYLYIKQKKYKEAIPNFNIALEDSKIIIDDPILYACLIDNLAYCRLKLNDNRNLPKLFFDAIEIREKTKNYNEIVGSYVHLSEYYQVNKNYEQAIKYSNEALRVAQESKIPINIILALKQASNVDDKNALKYSADYIRISDSLQIVERNSKDRFARLQLETDELRKENDGLVEQNRDILNYFLAVVAFLGFLFFLRSQRAKRREFVLLQSQQLANEELYALIISQQNKIDESKTYEKNRIAKELHDGVLGRMFGLRLNLDGLNSRTDEDAIGERLKYLDELKTIEQDLREISHELSREKFVLINNFVSIVNGLFEEQAKINQAKLITQLGNNIDWDLLSNTTKINLYRILQECLQNINKYANAKTINIEFKKDSNENLMLTIVDDGEGFDLNMKSKGIGMKNMVERTHESDGTIEIKSEKNKGTQVLVVVPLENKTIKV